MADDGVMDLASIPEAIEWQAQHAEKAGAPGTAQVIRGLLALENSRAATARRIFAWQGLSLRDAMPLRIAGGIHNLLLTGEEPRLADIYAGRVASQNDADTLIREIVEAHDAQLMPWLDGPPQTNEAGRSASFAHQSLSCSGNAFADALRILANPDDVVGFSARKRAHQRSAYGARSDVAWRQIAAAERGNESHRAC